MTPPPKPINIPDDIAACCPGPDQAQRMDALFRKVIAVPRSGLVKRSAEPKPQLAKE